MVEIAVAINGIAFFSSLKYQFQICRMTIGSTLDVASTVAQFESVVPPCLLEVASPVRGDIVSVYSHVEPRHAAVLADDGVIAVPLDEHIRVIESGVVSPNGER